MARWRQAVDDAVYYLKGLPLREGEAEGGGKERKKEGKKERKKDGVISSGFGLSGF